MWQEILSSVQAVLDQFRYLYDIRRVQNIGHNKIQEIFHETINAWDKHDQGEP